MTKLFFFLLIRLSQAVKLLIALAILFTYGLQFHIGFDVVWESSKHHVSKDYHGITQTLTRIVVVFLTGEFNFILNVLAVKR